MIDGASGKPATPDFPFRHADQGEAAASRRQQLARWVTSKDNQYFAKSYVNRLWGYLLGRGIIEPIDDIRAGNPPTNPELLERLTADFVASKFDMQHILRTICKSRTYQASIVTNRWNQDDDINFSHAVARRLPAEVLYDTIQRVTGTVSHLPGVPAGYRAAQLPDVGLTLPSGFFEVFGRPARESSCECERSSGMMLGPVMTLVNGPTIADAIADSGNELTRLVASEADDAKLVSEMFLRILSRPPTALEIEAGVQALHGTAGEHERLQAELTEYTAKLDAQQPQWESEQSGTLWTVASPTELVASNGAALERQPDQSITATGANGRGTYTLKFASDAPTLTGIRLEMLPDANLAAGGPGRAPNGNVVLTEIRGSIASKADPAQVVPLAFSQAAADFGQNGYPVANAIDGNPQTGWAIAPEFGKPHTGTFEVKDPVNFAGGTLITIVIDQQFDETHTLGKFRLATTASPRPLNPASVPEAILAIVAVPREQRSEVQRAELAAFYRGRDGQFTRLSKAVAISGEQRKNQRLTGAQDLAWALLNSPSFLFNH